MHNNGMNDSFRYCEITEYVLPNTKLLKNYYLIRREKKVRWLSEMGHWA